MTTPVWLDSFNTKVAPQGAWFVSAGRLFQSLIAVEWEGCWTSEHWRQVSVSVWSLKGRERAIIRRTLGVLQRRRWGNFWETGWSAYGLFRAHIYHVVLNSVWYVASSKFGIRIKGWGVQCWGHLSIASVVFSSASGQLLECLDCHHDLASYDFVKHGQARWLSLLFKTWSVQNAKHVVSTVGLLIFFFFFNHKTRATSVDIFDSRDILSACVWIPDCGRIFQVWSNQVLRFFLVKTGVLFALETMLSTHWLNFVSLWLSVTFRHLADVSDWRVGPWSTCRCWVVLRVLVMERTRL